MDGPYRDRVSYGPGIDAMSGLAHLTGYADGPPMKPGNFFCDQQAGTLAAFGTLAALRHRDRTGEGQHVELAMIEGELQLLADAYLDYEWNRRERMRCGNDHPRWAPHDAYRCAGDDAWVAIAVENDAQWQALCGLIGRGDLAADPRFALEGDRHGNRAALRPLIEAWTSERTHYELQQVLQAAGVPRAPC
jgi:crotonobetainyl-CoA:carnitine CoA-transferase CaiB-like acyl-CoA transferase